MYRLAAAMVLVAIVGAGAGAYIALGRPGARKFAIGCSAVLAAVLVIWSVAFTLFAFRAQHQRLLEMQKRVARLPADELRSMMDNSSDPALGFATAELSNRGVAAHPEKASLFAMLLSDNSWERGRGFMLLSLFYPEFVLPAGSSSNDPPEVWRERIRAWEEAE